MLCPHRFLKSVYAGHRKTEGDTERREQGGRHSRLHRLQSKRRITTYLHTPHYAKLIPMPYIVTFPWYYVISFPCYILHSPILMLHVLSFPHNLIGQISWQLKGCNLQNRCNNDSSFIPNSHDTMQSRSPAGWIRSEVTETTRIIINTLELVCMRQWDIENRVQTFKFFTNSLPSSCEVRMNALEVNVWVNHWRYESTTGGMSQPLEVSVNHWRLVNVWGNHWRLMYELMYQSTIRG